MEADLAKAIWSQLASLSNGNLLLILLGMVVAAAIARSSMRRKRRGTVKPIGYFSYLTHGGTVSVCAECGAAISERERRYCLSNPRRFGGMVYCRRHQRRQ
jgi:hypothetical protein